MKRIKIIMLLGVIISLLACHDANENMAVDNISIEAKADYDESYVTESAGQLEDLEDFNNGAYDVSLQSNATSYSMTDASQTKPHSKPQPVSAPKKVKPAKNRKMIWKGNLEFQVQNMETSSKKISAICEEEGAFISEMNMSSTNYKIENHVQIRVNNSHFHQLIERLKGESIYTDNISITSNDVTEEFIDIESRLNTKKEVRERYINILRKRTGSIKEVIEAEEAIRRITEEIEAKEGRLRYLKDQVNFSTISVNIYQKVEFNRAPEVYEKSFGDDVSDSFSNGWQFITIVFLVLVNLWPLLLAGIIFIVWWKYRKRR
ncbi:MAG: DUF4349 domain-containing protein [Crocinitomicaceae bacterium]